MDTTATNKSHDAFISKVPQITFVFWITKIISTGMGEVFSDFLTRNRNPLPGTLAAAVFLCATLIVQYSVRRYIAWVYWLTVIAISIFGTAFADFMNDGLHISTIVTTGVFIIAQAIIFIVWYAKEKTLSIHDITNRARESFYWSTVFITFALGTSAGDMAAFTLHMGLLPAGIMFAVLIALPAIGFLFFKLNEVFAFWFAYLMTRPLGASFSDWFSLPKSIGALGYGSGPVSLILTVAIAALVAHLSREQKRPELVATAQSGNA